MSEKVTDSSGCVFCDVGLEPDADGFHEYARTGHRLQCAIRPKLAERHLTAEESAIMDRALRSSSELVGVAVPVSPASDFAEIEAIEARHAKYKAWLEIEPRGFVPADKLLDDISRLLTLLRSAHERIKELEAENARTAEALKLLCARY